MKYVIKRNGKKEVIKFDKITARIAKQCYGLNSSVDPFSLSQKVIEGIYESIPTSKIDELAAETAAYMTSVHPDYSILAARIAITNLQKQTGKKFSDCIEDLYNHVVKETGNHAPLIADDVYKIVQENKELLDGAIITQRDLEYDYFGYKTLERSYLLRTNGQVRETPQFMLMRVALGIHKDNLEMVLRTYELLSKRYYTHATPTLFNSGTPTPQMSSCFLLDTDSDSIQGIYKTLTDCAFISKNAGGIGLNVHDIRGKGSYIEGTNGHSNGLVPMLQVFNSTARYVDQGGNKRKGAFAIYLEPWHTDIEDFLELRRPHGKEELRTRDLFLGLWIPDLFMERVKNDEDWTLMCPNECPGLSTVYGKEFVYLYTKYEQEGKGRKTLKARTIWNQIITSQVESGVPYMLYKDSINKKSAQSNLGTIKSSNLCTEIVQYTSSEEIAVCNLASIALPSFVKNGSFNFKKLMGVTKHVVKSLNSVIDNNMYPVPEAEQSNLSHRPMAIGVQGLADVFAMIKAPFDSEEAAQLNERIFAHMYYAALSASVELASVEGTYESYEGSPASKGKLQFDLWGVEPIESPLLDWNSLRKLISKNGLRNSLLIGPMPTASTAQILGNNECFEPFTSLIYVRRTNAGEFQIVNKHLVKDLIELDLWNESMKNKIIRNKGSIQGIEEIPEHIRNLYMTAWEISMSVIQGMAAKRGCYIDQSQSMNLWLKNPTLGSITSMHFNGWSSGLKTGMYYLRSQNEATARKNIAQEEPAVCKIDDEDCLVCGS